jgi:hypothetical protein
VRGNGLGSRVNATVTLPTSLSQLDPDLRERQVGEALRIMSGSACGAHQCSRTVGAEAQPAWLAIEAIEITEGLGAAR